MSSGLPLRLAASAPTWEREVDVVVVGSGAAGLAAALAVRPVRNALIVTKGTLDAGSTAWAQGGLAGVLDPADTLEDHVRDTLAAGAGLCDEGVVRELVAEAPKAIRYLMRLGAAFDPAGSDSTVPPSHARAATATTASSTRGATAAGPKCSGPWTSRRWWPAWRCSSDAFALDLVVGTSPDGARQAAGVTVALLGTDRPRHVGRHGSGPRATVLATGGWGQVFASTSNPPAVTGDGVAMALRAGLAVSDVEFVQFHPTVLWTGPDAVGQQALVSEAVRGEGAVLLRRRRRPGDGGRPPPRRPRPRDVVAAAISRRMARGTGGHRRPRSSTPPTSGPASPSASRPSTRPAEPLASTRPTTAYPSPRPPPTRAAACRPVSTAPPHSTASTRWARSRGPGCTAPTGWRRTASPRGSSPAPAWGAAWSWGLRAEPTAETDGPRAAAGR